MHQERVAVHDVECLIFKGQVVGVCRAERDIVEVHGPRKLRGPFKHVFGGIHAGHAALVEDPSETGRDAAWPAAHVAGSRVSLGRL
jgi:hypothetical protein